MSTATMRTQGNTLLDYLVLHPDCNIRELEQELRAKHGPAHTYVHMVISLIRNRYGVDVITCKYDRMRRKYVYRIAENKFQAIGYVKQRKEKIRNEMNNVIGLLERTEAKWPNDPDVRYARAMLQAAVDVLAV